METERKRVEVVATDGEEIRRLLWIEQLKDGSFYWGLVVPKSDVHSSYHASGTFRFSKYHEPLERQKLSNFKGISNLSTVAVAKDVKKIAYKPFKPKKLDGVVYIDFRAMKKNTVNIHLFLIEQGHPELLQGLLSMASPDLQITIFTLMKPWLVVAAQSF
ncbi:MAG: hypothetical protein ACTSV7_00530 [Candidatus Baldrarchaeia archaeon]